MATSNSRGQQKSASAKGVLPPILTGSAILLLLFGLRAFEILQEKTLVTFTVALEGTPLIGEYQATCNGIQVGSGSRLGFGRHRLVVEHPKSSVFSTNFFQFFGPRDLGRINLKRAHGNISVSIHPPAHLWIEGEDFKTDIDGATAFSNSLSTGTYRIQARFRHNVEERVVAVKEGDFASVQFEPKFGALEIASNERESRFQLLGPNGVVVGDGDLPSIVSELPPGEFTIIVNHHTHRLTENARVEEGKTNVIQAKFTFASLSIETTPPGAEIVGEDGHVWGRAPLLLSELDPGVRKLVLRLDSHESIPISVELKAQETNVVSQRLLHSGYFQAMQDGKAALAQSQFDRAIEAFQTALKWEPDGKEAARLLMEADVGRGMARAELLGKERNYPSAVAELKRILAVSAGNEKAITLLQEFERLAGINAENARIARLNRAKSVFKAVCESVPDARLFESMGLDSKKPVREVHTALIQALRAEPSFKVTTDKSSKDAFEIHAEQEFLTVLKTSAGKRVCLIVGAQVEDEKTEIVFKVLEYKVEAVNKFSIGNVIGTPAAVNYIPIRPDPNAPEGDKFQVRLREGIAITRTKMKTAIGLDD